MAVYPTFSNFSTTSLSALPMGSFSPRGFTVPVSGVEALVAQLGQHTRMGPNGMIQFNQPLIQSLVNYGEQTVPALEQFLRQTIPQVNHRLPQVLEAIFTAEQLLEAGVVGARRLYDVTSYLNTHPSPLLQIYLAGFYRELNRPEAFGPMFSTLMHQTQNQYHQQNPILNPTEEVGGTVLSMIAKASADETVKQLLPYLSPRPV